MVSIGKHHAEQGRVVALDADYLDRCPAGAVGSVELGYAITKYGAQGMTVDRAFVVLGDGLSKEEAYTALTRAREGTELYAVSREPVERAEFAPAKEEHKLGIDEVGNEMERSEQRALAIGEQLRGELECKPTAALVDELHRIDAASNDPGQRRLEAVAAAVAEAERDVGRAREALGETQTRHGAEQARLEAIAAHAAEQLRDLRSRELAARDAAPDPAARQRGAVIERILAERRRLSVERAIVAEPRYLTEALGRRPDGLRGRLAWERAVNSVERHRQLLDVRDPDRPLGEEPQGRAERARWRAARQELEAIRARVAEREITQDRQRVAGIGIER